MVVPNFKFSNRIYITLYHILYLQIFEIFYLNALLYLDITFLNNIHFHYIIYNGNVLYLILYNLMYINHYHLIPLFLILYFFLCSYDQMSYVNLYDLFHFNNKLSIQDIIQYIYFYYYLEINDLVYVLFRMVIVLLNKIYGFNLSISLTIHNYPIILFLNYDDELIHYYLQFYIIIYKNVLFHINEN